jgi:uncharacterized NAD-dependent epimerase/dehydratase family protein
MRRSSTPSIVPTGDNQNVYLVVDDFGRNGRVYRETDVETADLETTILDLMAGEYRNPIRVVAFNTTARWSEDVSKDIAREIRRRFDLQAADVPSAIQDFVETCEGNQGRQLSLRLV